MPGVAFSLPDGAVSEAKAYSEMAVELVWVNGGMLGTDSFDTGAVLRAHGKVYDLIRKAVRQ